VVCSSSQELIVDVQLKINSEEIELNKFVENFVSQTIIGMVKSLRGVSDINTIDLKITKKGK
jgi:hypothetical protein